ncbi:MAG: hypothetical protein ACE5GD_08170 [Candidatus Geothermarchaeales archaeon]
MPKPEGYTTLNVKRETYERLRKVFKSEAEKLEGYGIKTYDDFLNFALTQLLELPPPPPPRMEHVNTHDNYVSIRDNELGRTIDVYFHGGVPGCGYCEKRDCIHVGFALGIPEVQQALSRHGAKIDANRLI